MTSVSRSTRNWKSARSRRCWRSATSQPISETLQLSCAKSWMQETNRFSQRLLWMVRRNAASRFSWSTTQSKFSNHYHFWVEMGWKWPGQIILRRKLKMLKVGAMTSKLSS
jgi:hypothetical protein